MPEFRPPSYGPMDREHYTVLEFDNPKEKSIEEPIFPIGEIGQTIPETDPSGRFKTFIQQAQASIRMGAGNLQLAMTVPHTSAMGGRFKAYGKEIREALREVALASQVQVSGVEMPTSSLTNMSGYDPQRNRFSDEVRKDHLDEVKDAIKFVAEACGGGGVDLVSWEFERPINDASWNNPEKKLKDKTFQQPGEMEVIQVVDTKTGGVVQLRKGETQHLGYVVPTKPEHIAYYNGRWQIKSVPEKEFTEKGEPNVIDWDWEKFEKTAKFINDNKKEGQPEIKPETLLIQMQLESQRKTAEGYAGHYGSQAVEHKKRVTEAQNIINNFDSWNEEKRIEEISKLGIRMPSLIKEFAEDKNKLEAFKSESNTEYQHLKSLAEGQMQQVKEIEERQKRFTAVSEYAVQKAVDSYAEAGIAAMQETHNKNTFAKHPIHVGPEIGWPQFYGSHPQEFVKLIQDSRKEMVRKLTIPYLDEKGRLSEQKTNNENNFFQKGLSEQQAQEQAKEHIKGVFDTSHLGMWLRNFRPDLPWEKRVDEFNKWFTKEVELIAEVNKKEQIIGAIQAVDSATGAHAHLPPGQGILPVFEAVKILKEKGGFKGFLVSEGHEEEKFGEGRILMKAWEKFGGHLENSGYRPSGAGGPPLMWNRINNAYFGKTYSPSFIFGSYAPSNEFKLWSEIPFE